MSEPELESTVVVMTVYNFRLPGVEEIEPPLGYCACCLSKIRATQPGVQLHFIALDQYMFMHRDCWLESILGRPLASILFELRDARDAKEAG